MNRAQIRKLARRWLDDRTSPGNLYSNDDLNEYINEAIRRAVVRGRLIVDSTTPSITEITVIAGTARYPLNKSIIVARRFEFQASTAGARPHVLRRRSFDEVDRSDCSWRDMKSQVPHLTVQDLDQHVVTLVGIPQLDGMLRLTVWRYPVACELLNDDATELTIIKDDFHERLAHWVCYRALGTLDAETRNPEEESRHLGLFTEAFGPEPSAQDLRRLAVDREYESVSHHF